MLHVLPESYIGGPLALLKTGDIVSADVDASSIRLDGSNQERARRRAAWTAPAKRFERGYGWVFTRHMQQTDKSCAFLDTYFGEPVIYWRRPPRMQSKRHSIQDDGLSATAQTRRRPGVDLSHAGSPTIAAVLPA
jgi:hypothetical protein